MAQIEHTPIALTSNEKMMILSVHSYLQKNMPKRQSKEATNLLAEFNKTGKISSSKQGHWAPKDFQAEYVNKIHDIINSAKMVVSCWRKCLGKARDYWEMIEDEINDESDDSDNESLDLCSGDENFDDFCSECEDFDDRP
ncbi:10226_t:CDS:2 [Gigaspora margarita]|uniref:10226_t:CDS:1 n=1 Tax=Gigaspora margarita TaxID=4874 RepID=A0ABM8VY12_GIGMA|nr:10226_t:CDS:2 [Gigaspora margarita]